MLLTWGLGNQPRKLHDRLLGGPNSNKNQKERLQHSWEEAWLRPHQMGML